MDNIKMDTHEPLQRDKSSAFRKLCLKTDNQQNFRKGSFSVGLGRTQMAH